MPFSDVQINAHRFAETPAGATVLITYTGRQTGAFNGVRPTGRWFAGTGAVVFQVEDGRICGTTTVLEWNPTTPEPASNIADTFGSQAECYQIEKAA